MRLLTLYLPVPWIKALDELVAAKLYANRTDAIRMAVRDLLIAEAWNNPGTSESNTSGKTVKKMEC